MDDCTIIQFKTNIIETTCNSYTHIIIKLSDHAKSIAT